MAQALFTSHTKDTREAKIPSRDGRSHHDLSFSRISSLVEGAMREAGASSGYLSLVANEATMSDLARSCLSGPLSERYYSGAGNEFGFADFQTFTCLGLPAIRQLIDAAEHAVKEMLHAATVNLAPLSGMHAMICTLAAATNRSDLVATINPTDGGHFATSSVIERLGRRHCFIPFDGEQQVDIEMLKLSGARDRIAAVYLDVMYTITPLDIAAIRAALPAETLLIYDASHLMGLIMGGVISSPLLDGADIICGNTHKTVPGPHKGLIAYRSNDLGVALNKKMQSLYSSTHCHHLVALSIALLEMYHFGRRYSQAIVANSNELGRCLSSHNFSVRSIRSGAFTRTHQLHVDIDHTDDYLSICRNLVNNKVLITFTNALGPNIFMRLGTQDITRRGATLSDMRLIADIISRCFEGDDVRDEVEYLNQKLSTVGFSFDSLNGFCEIPGPPR